MAGELQIYVTEARDLGVERFREKVHSECGEKLQVRLGFRAPRSLAELFTSVFVDETLMESLETNLNGGDVTIEHFVEDSPSWRTPTRPAGEMRNMGRLAHLPKSNALLTVTVCIPYIENGVEQLYVFGNAEIPLMHLLDEHSPTNYYWLLLQNESGKNQGQIKIWTMFYPEDKALQPAFLYPDDPARSYAAQLLSSAEKQEVLVDSYKQPILLGNYNPNYMRVEQDFLRGFAKGKAQPEDERIVNKMLLSKINPIKSSFEPWEYRLLTSYRFLRQQARTNMYSSMSRYLWDAYLIKLMMNITKTRTLAQSGPIEAAKLESTLGSQLQKTCGTLLKLDRIKFWKEAGSWKYSEIVSLCRTGLPKELRPSIWSELFGLSESKSPGFEDSKRAKFEGYVIRSMDADSVVYRQMEHDVLEALPSSSHDERAGILKIAKAYYAWCMEQNSKSDIEGNPKQSLYGYFKGVMRLVQKVWQLFPEAEAFWCVVGFAKALPYLFESRDVMAGKLSWSHKLLLLAMSTIIEKQYPEIHRALLRHGLPVEHYVSDKLFSLLSTVYPTETLLRLYDIIALEAGSEEPIRAVWVLLSGCIMLFVLNEAYIKAARSAEEIELLINNTGVNNMNTQKVVEQTCGLSGKLFTTYNPSWEKLLAIVISKEDSVMGMERAWTNKANVLDAQYQKVKELNVEVGELLESIRRFTAATDDSAWIGDFIAKFRNDFSSQTRKATPDRVFVYIYRCHNLTLDPGRTEDYLVCEEANFQKLSISPDGMVDQLVEFRPATPIKISVPGSGACEIAAIEDYESDLPIPMDKALCWSDVSHIGRGEGQTPQPFISLVLLVASKDKGLHVDEAFECVKKSMAYESKIVAFSPSPSKSTRKTQAASTVTKPRPSPSPCKPLTAALECAAVYPSSTNDDLLALRRLFGMLSTTHRAKEEEEEHKKAPASVEDLAQQAYRIFAKYYDGRLPVKRVLVSLIASASLTVSEKLGYFYDICVAINGQAQGAFRLEDVTELVQLLYELHLIYVPAEYIPRVVEYVMTNGGVNRITNAYLLGAGVDVAETLRSFHVYHTGLITM